MLDGWLPTRFRRAGIMAAGAGGSGSAADAGGEESAGTGAGDGWGISSIAGEVAEGAAGEVQPLASESHWRLYENATFLSSQLDRLAAAGLNLQVSRGGSWRLGGLNLLYRYSVWLQEL